MTMTLGFSVRPLDRLPTDALIHGFSALSKMGAAPLMRLVVPGTYDGPGDAYDQPRWSAEEAGQEKEGYFCKRILEADAKGQTHWLSNDEASPIFADMKAAGDFVSIPNSLAADRFYMLPELALPWPLKGPWLKLFPDRRYQLSLPGTPLDGMNFGVHQYLMLLCKGSMEGTEDFSAQDVNSVAQQAHDFFRCAQRHKLITDFY